jgi:hypothetical protein
MEKYIWNVSSDSEFLLEVIRAQRKERRLWKVVVAVVYGQQYRASPDKPGIEAENAVMVGTGLKASLCSYP